MPRPRIVFRQSGWRGMQPRHTETNPPDLVYYALNMVPLDPVNGGPYVGRADDELAAIGSATTMQHLGVFDKRSGALVVGIASGEIYTWSQSGGTWSRQVTTANLATATVTLATSGRVRCTTYNNTYVINDGANRPFTWDGTAGAGGLVSLSNAPSKAYGQPVVYYAKLFFIKDVAASSADRSTIVWSEENAANTGYEASGYNNAWTLSQTGGGSLSCLVPSNDALYYCRSDSTGAIRGAVTPDFATAGVHDSVSVTVGTPSPDGAVLYDNILYICDSWGRAWRYVPGGVPQEMSVGALIPRSSIAWQTTYPSTTASFWVPVPLYRCILLLGTGFPQVAFAVDTGLPVCVWTLGATPVCGGAVPGDIIAGSVPVPVTMLGTVQSAVAKTVTTPSRNQMYGGLPLYGEAYVEMGPFSAGEDTVSHFSKLDAVLYLGDDNGSGGANGSVIHKVINAETYEPGAATTTVATIALPAPNASQTTPVRQVVGISRELRSLRWKIDMTSFPTPGWGVQRIAVEAFPMGPGPSKAT